MNAFMAYKEKTVVDFESMIDHGLYLISGPTGAGKTTIFDAMTFALYGVASGSHRNQSYFRSDFADAKEETYVELVFELHNRIYTIKRSPTYMRPGYKTAKMANAYLSYDEVIIEGVKEVNQKLNQLLGVDVHQFKQIVMIAQGEFTKLIYASSEEREKVLRHIFHSEPLVAFENLLKEESKACKDQYLLSSQQLLSRFQLLTLPDEFMKAHCEDFHPSYIEEAHTENQNLYEHMLTLQHNYEEYKTQYDHHSQIYYQKEKQNNDFLEYQSLKQSYEKLMLKEQTMFDVKKDIDKLKILEQNQSFLYQYQQTQQELHQFQKQYHSSIKHQQTLQQQYISIEKDYQTIPKLRKQKDNCLLKIENIQQLIQKQKDYQILFKQYQQLIQKHQKNKDDYQRASEQYQNLLKRMERDQENVNRLPQLQLELQQNEQKVKEMNQRRVSIHDLSELYDHFTEYQDKHFDLSERYQKVDQAYQMALQHYQQEDENFKRQQAGILAGTLQENQPCPVCGSLHHPHPASLSQQVLSSNELEELSHIVDKKKILKEEAYQDVVVQNNHIHEIRSQIDILKKQLQIDDELSKEVFIQLLSDIIQVTKDQEKTYLKRHNEVEYLKKIKYSLEQDQSISQQQNHKLETWLQEIHNEEKQMVAFQTQLDQLTSQNVHLSDENYNQELIDQQKQLKRLQKQIDSLDQLYHQCQKDLSVVNSQMETLSLQIKEKEQLFLNMNEQFDTFVSQYFQSLEEYQNYQLSLNTLPEKEKNYQEYEIQKGTLIGRLKNLEDTVKDYTLVDLSQEKVKLHDLEEKRDHALKTYNESKHVYEQNQLLLKNIQKDYQRNQDIFEKYTIYQDLSDITAGKNGQRMSFERYVLSSYFEHILEYANIELLKMSNGRYALYRKQETKGAKQQGLDLSVLDYETGMMRDIQSLSGGESFKAALSLALGLSSMIQSYAGGIELNTLFIDEGFGTLDSESIDQALSVLLDLKNDQKVIGIISHVDELKEKITTQIVVEKGATGSLLHIEKE